MWSLAVTTKDENSVTVTGIFRIVRQAMLGREILGRGFLSIRITACPMQSNRLKKLSVLANQGLPAEVLLGNI